MSKEVTRIYFRIRELRKARGMTQARLAQNLGLRSSSTVAMWEKDIRKPPSTILPRLAAELGCSTIDELYNRDQLGQNSSGERL